MPRLPIASDEEAAALRSQLANERAMRWAQAYTRFPTNMGKLLLSRPAYGGPFLELFQRLIPDWNGSRKFRLRLHTSRNSGSTTLSKVQLKEETNDLGEDLCGK